MTITAQAAIAAINEALAKGPTPGPWRRAGWRVEREGRGVDPIGPAVAICSHEWSNADAYFIAACTPEAIAAVVAHVEAQAARIAELEAAIAFADRQTEKVEAPLDPHIKWETRTMKSPTETSLHTAAQLWCLPAHSAKEIDTALVRDIAYAIDAAVKAERERCARIAETGWVSADYNTVGIADADMAMALCEHIVDAIRGGDNG